jgi:hypothetical protein
METIEKRHEEVGMHGVSERKSEAHTGITSEGVGNDNPSL